MAETRPPAAPSRLAIEHFAAAMVYLLAASAGMVWIAPDLASGSFLSPRVAGVTHLFTLGWLTMTIFGALYQLLPGALGAPIRWPKLGHAGFWTFAPGAGLFACGVAENSAMLHHAGIGLVAIGVVCAVMNIGMTLAGARSRDVTWAAIVVAVSYLFATLVLGVVLLHNMHTGFIAAARVGVLATHLHVAIVGWALIMIVGVAHRLFPMFLLAHRADARWTPRALILLAGGVPLLALGLNAGLPPASWAAVTMMELGLACFVYQAALFFRARMRKRIDVGMRFAAAGLTFLVVGAVLGPVVLWRGAAAPRMATTYVFLGLVAGIILFVCGFFYKIVPMLAWTTRYAGRSAPRAPSVAEMYSSRVAEAQLAAMVGAVVTLAAGILAGSTAVAYAGASLFTVGVLVFASQIARVAFGNPAVNGPVDGQAGTR